MALLGSFLLSQDEKLGEIIGSSPMQNPWFTPQNTRMAVRAIGKMLNQHDLESWIAREGLADHMAGPPKSIGLVLAGNIPLVGFHDILCVLVSGNKAMVKLSSQDQKLIPFLLEKLVELLPALKARFEFTDRLAGFDAVIATGSGNTSRYFDYYFKNVPHIIRKNRNSIAILTGKESANELKLLGKDIFDYFGLGCRNVSKLYVPRNYNFREFFEAVEDFNPVANHHKYNNNYDYNKSIFLVNQDKHLDNGFLLLKESTQLASPLAVLYYEEYTTLPNLENTVSLISDAVQCVISNHIFPLKSAGVAFGDSQQPKLWDYADRVNTMQFLKEL